MTIEELLRIAKPILFNTDMVRAILDGRKTVTRRVIKEPKNFMFDGETSFFPVGKHCEKYLHMDCVNVYDSAVRYIRCPYRVNDILYVRETWCWEPCWDCGMDTEEHNCCDESATKFFNHNKREWGCYCYKASCEDNEYPSVDTWHPSLHMPKEAARIFLKVTDVRVERLQDITEEQAKAEGAIQCYEVLRTGGPVIYQANDNKGYYAIGFKGIWNSTIKKSDLDCYGWDANPWVWVIEFERMCLKW